MSNKQQILSLIKNNVKKNAPRAEVILFGSYARGDFNKYSDIDLIVIVDKEDLTFQEKNEIKYSLYEIEFQNGIVISPIVFSRNEWNITHQNTPFYENVINEGIRL